MNQIAEWKNRLSQPLPLKERDVWIRPFDEEIKSDPTFLLSFLLEVARLKDLESYTAILLKVRWFMSVSANFKPDWLDLKVWRQIETVVHKATDLLTPAYRIPVSEWAEFAVQSQQVLEIVVKQEPREDIQSLIEKLYEAKRKTLVRLAGYPEYAQRIEIARGEPIY